jgi:hypothetical protein
MLVRSIVGKSIVVGCRLEPPESPGVTVGGDVLVNHRRHLPVLVQWWELLSFHCLIGHGGGGSRRCNLALCFGSTLMTGHRNIIGIGGSLINFAKMVEKGAVRHSE